jgi:hypothetical protein
MLKKYIDTNVVNPANTRLIKDWDLFKEKLREVFFLLNKATIAK